MARPLARGSRDAPADVPGHRIFKFVDFLGGGRLLDGCPLAIALGSRRKIWRQVNGKLLNYNDVYLVIVSSVHNSKVM